MQPEGWTILNLLKWTASYFESHSIEQPRTAAEMLLAHALGLNRVDLYVQYDRPLEPQELKDFKELIRRRLHREPVAYITGERGFWSLDLKVTPDVLIPRPETEVLVEETLSLIPPEPSPMPLRILDLGTGSGAIILSLASERPSHSFYGTDNSHKALAVAEENCRRHALLGKVILLHGHWFDAVKDRPGGFDLIVSNPPYVPDADFEVLAPEITQYEPRQALQAGPDGLNAIRIIIEEGADYLTAGGWLLLEISPDQRTSVEALISASGRYKDLSVTKDYNGLDRVIRARMSFGSL
jgi:release factor glutamine methyltransferase